MRTATFIVAAMAIAALAASAANAAPADCAPLAAPSGLKLKAVSATGAEVAWRAPKAPADLCVEAWKYLAVPTASAASAGATLPARSEIKCGGIARKAGYTAVLTGLKPATEYRFMVSGANSKGASPDATLVFTTKSA